MKLPDYTPPPPPMVPLTEKEIEAVEEMAAHGFTIKDIAEVIRPEAITGFISAYKNIDSKVYKSIRRGALKSELELRQRIFIDAKHGSSPAQALAKKLLDEAQFNNHCYE